MNETAFVSGPIQALLDDIDDWCGTKPHRPIPPRPWGEQLKDLLLATAIGDLAMQIGQPEIKEQAVALTSRLQDQARGEIAQFG